MTRLYTAKKDGQVVRRGSFSSLALLKLDFPSPEFELVLDEHLPFPQQDASYSEQRRMAYPPLADFADALYWSEKGDPSRLRKYFDNVSAVKAQFPKPGGT